MQGLKLLHLEKLWEAVMSVDVLIPCFLQSLAHILELSPKPGTLLVVNCRWSLSTGFYH